VTAAEVDGDKRGHFVWESKKLKAGVRLQATGATPTKAFDDALLRARQQAEDHARALPAKGRLVGGPEAAGQVDDLHMIYVAIYAHRERHNPAVFTARRIE
jgi:hypothetical protein